MTIDIEVAGLGDDNVGNTSANCMRQVTGVELVLTCLSAHGVRRPHPAL